MTTTDLTAMTATRVITPPVLYPGTAVVLLTTTNPDGSTNLAPMSSVWALGDSMMLGLGTQGQTFGNLSARGECVVNYASEQLWERVEALAPLTGASPVPPGKASYCRTERDKFGASGLTAVDSELVTPRRVAECPLQIECRVVAIHPLRAEGAAGVEVTALRVHAHESIAAPDDRHIVVDAWRPLFYLFRHYAGRGPDLGRSFRATD